MLIGLRGRGGPTTCCGFGRRWGDDQVSEQKRSPGECNFGFEARLRESGQMVSAWYSAHALSPVSGLMIPGC